MEQLGVPPDVMRKRVEETLDLLGIADLRGRGRCARCRADSSSGSRSASVLTAHPRVLVLDEPTSALDPTAAEEVLAAVTRLVHDLGVTVVLAEHRLERVVQYCDRVVLLRGDGTVVDGAPARSWRRPALAPPVVELGRLAGWNPLPLSVRDARRPAGGAPRRRWPRAPPPARGRGLATGCGCRARRPRHHRAVRRDRSRCARSTSTSIGGEVVALMGRNGSGQVVAALGARRARVLGSRAASTHRASGRARAASSQRPAVPADGRRRVRTGRRRRRAPLRAPPPRCSTVSPSTFALGAHPRDLSEGQRLALVLALQLTGAPACCCSTSRPAASTRRPRQRFSAIVAELARAGHAVVLATHDVELVAGVADRVVVMADGEVVADGPTADVVCASPAFAPQVAKILRRSRGSRSHEVAAALA